MLGAIPGSGAAGETERSRRRRSRFVPRRGPGRRRALGALVPALGGALLISGCTGAPAGGDPEQTSGQDPTAGKATPTASAEADPALVAACGEFWGDPLYQDPTSRVVLDRAATAPDAGPSDPFFYAMTGDDVDLVFEDAPEDARTAASTLAEWFRTEPERGTEADLEAFRSAWDGLAGTCQGVSVAASWTVAPGAEGTKPAALVCADVFDTPGTLTHFANANVLTSNMFKLVGLSAQQVPGDRTEDVRATDELLAAEIAAVDDPAVGAALEQVRAPFQDALAGDTASDGLQQPLDQLSTACDAAGYSAPELGEDGGAVVGAGAARGNHTDHEGLT
ncbi:hypothetical protein [Brachybacterium sp. YJGR34]|uniref:hypothetical protein n=1 Tax=Brachybacterium sp. YJGR34 TaxID=2059911 RepID=UPI001E5E13EC|nr:hypothetical protein [Brachybacterium sp. YJGR34]